VHERRSCAIWRRRTAKARRQSSAAPRARAAILAKLSNTRRRAICDDLLNELSVELRTELQRWQRVAFDASFLVN
jgi:hypothetical protein